MANSTLARLPVEMRREIATISSDPFAFTYGGRLNPNDETLATRGGAKGIKIYDDIERDSHAYAVLQKRKMAVIGCEWEVNAASDAPADKLAADIVKAALQDVPFDQICLDLLDAILKGYSVGEIIWTYRNGRIVPQQIKIRDQRRFVFNDPGDNPGAPKPQDIDGYDPAVELRMLTRSKPYDGEPVPRRKFIVHRFGSKDGNPYGLGLGTRLFWPVFFKRKGISFWLIFADKFGSPTAVGKYPAGADKADVNKLLDALQAIATDAGVVIPEEMAIELLEAARSGSVDTYERLCRYMDEQISECVLGETLSTNIGQVGSKAAAAEHNDVRRELTKADADLLSDTLNATLVKWIAEFNVPNARPPKLWRNTDEPEDLNALAARDRQIADLGFEPSGQYIQETYGEHWTKRPKQLSARPASTIPMLGDPASFAARIVDTPSRFADQLDGLTATILEGWIEKVREVFAEAASIEDARDKLLEIFPKLSVDELSHLIEQALIASEAAGRYEGVPSGE